MKDKDKDKYKDKDKDKDKDSANSAFNRNERKLFFILLRTVEKSKKNWGKLRKTEKS